MKKLFVTLLTTMFFLGAACAATAATIDIPVKVDKGIKNDGSVSEGLTLSYQWAENNRWQSFFGFDLSGHIALESILSINSITFNVYETFTYYTGNNVHVYNSNNDDWATGTYTYGDYGSSLGSKYFAAGAATPGGDPVDPPELHSYNVTSVAGSLTDNGKLGLYLALPTKDDWHNYAFHKVGENTAYLTIDYEPAIGDISGTVYQSDGTTLITGTSIQVNVYSGNPCGHPTHVTSTYTNPTDGTYYISDLPAGTYYLKTWNNGSPYLDEWWSYSASSTNCLDAGLVTVTNGEITSYTDFQLDASATISGTVYQNDGVTPITGDQIRVRLISGDPCASYQEVQDAYTDSQTGTYTIGGVPPGTYYLWTDAMNQSNYVNEWWSSTGSVFNCSAAQSITVTGTESITGKDFQLDEGATISGTVFQSDGSTAVTGVEIGIAVYSGDPCSSIQHIGGTNTNSADGTYLITGVPQGTYYLNTGSNGTYYMDEWWASPASTRDCNGAQSFAVNTGQTITGKNFQLDEGGIISGTVYQNDGYTPITGNQIRIRMFSGDPCGSFTELPDTYTDSSNGTYVFGGVPAGTYYLQTDNRGANYTNEWWASPTSTTSCSGAQSITVVVGTTVAEKNFQLDAGATISGTVYQSDGSTPITESGVGVQVITGDPCGAHQGVAWAIYNTSTGTYEIGGLLPGTYYLRTYTWGNVNYVNEWWATSGSTFDCSGAQSITVTGTESISGKNFQLDEGATVSGTVFKSDGVTPITGVQINVTVYGGDPCGSTQHIAGSSTDSTNGTYSISGIPAGNYYLTTHDSGTIYQREWWASPQSTVDCTGAQSFSTTAGQIITGKNFQLAEGGTISGTVYQSDGTTPITGKQIRVRMFSGDPCGSRNELPDTYTDSSNGTYVFGGVPAGTYYLQTDNRGANYTNEWWASPTSTSSCSGAQSITVTTGNAVTGKNFQLDAGATISGTVYQSDGTTPITESGVNVQVITGDPCGTHQSIGWASYNTSTGTYEIGGLVPGTYYLHAWGSTNYVNEWWAESGSIFDCSGAQSITVTGTESITGKDFQLDEGATISGTVYQSDGTTPVTGVQIHVNVQSGDPCSSAQHVIGSVTDSTNGTYTITGVPAGTYHLLTWNNGTHYLDEWWASSGSTVDCSGAQAISVTAGQTITDNNFQLDEGGIISGTVYHSDGITPITDSHITVDALIGNPCAFHHVHGANTNTADGTYTIGGIPAGTYYLGTSSRGAYMTEWWALPTSTIICSDAQAVTVNAGDTIPGKNFQLDTAEAISGVVTSDIDGQPIEGAEVCGSIFTTGEGDCTTTQSDGSYTLSIPLQGYLRFQASHEGYLTEYYNNTYDYNWATAVWVTAGQATPNIDFSMGNYGSISGTVFQSDGTTPLPNVCVGAYMHACGSNRYAAGQADGDGNYTISGLPPGDYHVHTGAACTTPLHYVDLWWTDGGGTIFCDQAGTVTVASEGDTQGINFSLTESETVYPGPSFDSAGVFSAHLADGSIKTTFFAFINGPSPKDTVSLTATGPSGTFTLTPAQTPFRQRGIFYAASSNTVVDDGTYTFVVTDSLGRTATVEKIFTYDSTVPRVDVSTMKVNGMDNQAYVGTTTPTLSWEPVDGTGYYYQAFIYDYDGRAIWYFDTTEGTSVTVPEGYLQPDSPYKWWVRTCNIPETGQRGQNRHYSDTLYFYTGEGGLVPDVSRNIPYSYTSPANPGAIWFGVTNTHLAPWDIGRLQVIGPYGTVYPYSGRSWFGYTSMYYNCWMSGLFPIPDGTYTYEITDKASNTYTANMDHTYQYVPPISEESRVPADNAYLYTKTPTFSWQPPVEPEAGAGGELFYYSLRLYDYNSRVAWYSSPVLTDTTFTLPENATDTAPPGSYKWQVRVYKGPPEGYDNTNAAISSNRSFAVPPLSDYDYTLPGGTGDPADYVMFTVPLYMGTGADLLKAMEKALGPYSPPTHWRIFAYMYLPGNNPPYDYREINSLDFTSMTIEPGMAFWIISVNNNNIQLDGALAPQTTYYEKTLGSGWNLFALPWPATSIDLGKIAVTDGTNTYWLTSGDNSLTTTYVYGFDRDYIRLENAGDVVEAKKGFWIYMLADPSVTVKILIPPDNNGGHFPVQPTGVPDGLTQVTNYLKPPPPPGGYPPPLPSPDIKANGEDGPVTISSGTPVSIKIGLDPGDKAGQKADWWIAARTPFDWYTYVHSVGWQPGIYVAAQAPLFELSPPFEVLNMTLPIGEYTFYFAVDNNADGRADGTWLDSIDVKVE